MKKLLSLLFIPMLLGCTVVDEVEKRQLVVQENVDYWYIKDNDSILNDDNEAQNVNYIAQDFIYHVKHLKYQQVEIAYVDDKTYTEYAIDKTKYRLYWAMLYGEGLYTSKLYKIKDGTSLYQVMDFDKDKWVIEWKFENEYEKNYNK